MDKSVDISEKKNKKTFEINFLPNPVISFLKNEGG